MNLKPLGLTGLILLFVILTVLNLIAFRVAILLLQGLHFRFMPGKAILSKDVQCCSYKFGRTNKGMAKRRKGNG